jgi:hypothetical protein
MSDLLAGAILISSESCRARVGGMKRTWVMLEMRGFKYWSGMPLERRRRISVTKNCSFTIVTGYEVCTLQSLNICCLKFIL